MSERYGLRTRETTKPPTRFADEQALGILPKPSDRAGEEEEKEKKEKKEAPKKKKRKKETLPAIASFFEPKAVKKEKEEEKEDSLHDVMVVTDISEVADMFLGKEERKKRKKEEEYKRAKEEMMLDAFNCERVIERVNAGLKPNPFFLAPPSSSSKKMPTPNSTPTPVSSQSQPLSQSPALAQSAADESVLINVTQPVPVTDVRSDVMELVERVFSAPEQALPEIDGRPIGIMAEQIDAVAVAAAAAESPAVAIGEDESTLRMRALKDVNSMRPGEGSEDEEAGDDLEKTIELFGTLSKVRTESEGCAELWVDRYEPEKRSMICGNAEGFFAVSKWLAKWAEASTQRRRKIDEDEDEDSEDEAKRKAKMLLVVGRGCTCKTAGIGACAEELGMEVFEINASSQRSGKDVVQLTSEASLARQIWRDEEEEKRRAKRKRKRPENKKRLFLFEDVDVWFSSDAGLHSAIASLAETSQYPIVATCSDPASREVGKLRDCSCTVNLARPTAREVAFWARLFLLSERGWAGDCSDVVALASVLGGRGIRGVVNAVQFWSLARFLGATGFLEAVLGIADPCSHFGSVTALLSSNSSKRIADALEACHAQDLDVGFDNWLEIPTDGLGADRLAATADLYSAMDAASGPQGGWKSPQQTLRPWNRQSRECCDFEAAVLSSVSDKRKQVLTGKRWHSALPRDTLWDVAAAAVGLTGLWPDGKIPRWLLEREEFIGTELVPLVSRICWSEEHRKEARLTRRFTHYLSCISQNEIDFVNQAAALRKQPPCECCSCIASSPPEQK